MPPWLQIGILSFHSFSGWIYFVNKSLFLASSSLLKIHQRLSAHNSLLISGRSWELARSLADVEPEIQILKSQK